MKIQKAPNLNSRNSVNNNQPNQTFGVGEFATAALTFLQTNQGVGAGVVDAACMCTPRTIVDYSRSPEAGVETARREFSSNINDGLLGAYGLGAAYLLSQRFNKDYGGIQAHKMPVDKDRMDVLSELRYRSGDLKSEENLKKYFTTLIDSTTGLENETWNGVRKDKGEIIDRFIEQVKVNPDKVELTDAEKVAQKEAKSYLKTLIVGATGSESNIKVSRTLTGLTEKATDEGHTKVLESTSSVDDFIDEVIKVTKAFRKDEVSSHFNATITNDGDILNAIKNNKFLNEFKGLKLKTAVLGLAVCAGIGAATQPINMYLTKRKTGKSGFVGGGEENKSTSFKLLKAGVAATAAAAMLRTIGKFGDIATKVQFKGIWPTIPQFKLVYGITIISRLLSSRNENELRESTIKDTLGFANWLILGGFVSKLTAMGLEKVWKPSDSSVDNVFVNYNKADNEIKSGWFKGWHLPKWIAGEVVSREEVIHQALSKEKLINGGKVLSFVEKLKALPKGARTKVNLLAVAQASGYLWSALALGFGMPKLNIAITKHFEKKKQEQLAKA